MPLTLPSNEVDRKTIKNAVSEISASWTRVEAERDHVNSILEKLEEEFELPKKEMRKVARIYHKQNLNEVLDEAESIEEAYNGIMGLQSE